MERIFYKLDIDGIVYLIDPTTAAAYTYDLSNPIEVGKVLWTDAKQPPKLELLGTWKDILQAKLESFHTP